jgi:porin
MKECMAIHGLDRNMDDFQNQNQHTNLRVYDFKTMDVPPRVYGLASARTRRLWWTTCCSLWAGCFLPASGLAAEGEAAALSEEGRKAAEEEAAPARLIGSLSEWRQRMSAKGFDFSAEYLSEVVGNVSGGVKRGAIYEGLVKLGLDFDAEKLLGWRGGSWHVSGLYAHGQSPSEKLSGDSLTLSNLDAYDSVYLFEIWVQQTFLDGAVSLRLGQLAADEEFAGTEYGGLFVHAATGWPPFISMNVPAPAYPIAAPGVRLEVQPTGSTFVRLGLFDGNPDPGDANGNSINKHGVTWNLGEGAFLISEAGVFWNQNSEARGLPGTAKIGGWYHTERFDDQRLDNTGLSLANPATTGVAASHRGNWGIYGAVEQMVYRVEKDAPQGLGVFGRAGGSPSDRNVVSYYLEGGLHYQGLIPSRGDDIAGLAFSYAKTSSAVRGLAADDNAFNGSGTALPDYELAIQLTYQMPIMDGWTLQPSVWWIVHPGGSSATPDSLLVGLRSNLEF